MKIYLLLASLFITFNINAQDKDFYLIDSVDFNTLITKKADLDKILTNWHNEKNDTIRFQNFLDQIESIYDKKLQVRYYEYIFEIVDQYISSAKNDALLHKFYFVKANALYQIAYFENELGFKPEMIIQKYKSAAKWFKLAKSDFGLAHAYNSIAYIQDEIGAIQEAIDNYNEAIHRFEKIKDTSGIAMVLINIAYVQTLSKDTISAKKSFLRSLVLAKKANNDLLYAIGLAEYSDFLLKREQCDSLNFFLKEAIDLTLLHENYVALSKAYVKMGKYLYRCENQKDSALYYYQQSLEISKKYNYISGIGFGNFRIGEWYYFNNDYKTAIPLLEKAYSIFADLNDEGGFQDCAEVLHEIYAHEGQWEKAYKYSQINFHAVRKLHSKDLRTKVIRQNFEYEYDKQKAIDDLETSKKIAIAEEQKEKQKLMVISVIIIAIIIALGLLIIYSRLRIIKKQKKALNIAYEKLELQKDHEVLASNLKALQSQMNPHFIFNALNSIQSLVLKGNVDSSYDYINQFASLVRTTLNFSEQKFVYIEDEIELLDTYLNLEKLRFKDDFEFSIEKGEVPSIKVPPMLVQPFVENALKHGLLHIKTVKKIHLKFHLEDALICEIEDNGIGRKAAEEIKIRRSKNHKSFATTAMKKRFEMLQKDFEYPIGFLYEDIVKDGEALGTKVIVRIPFIPVS